MINLSGKGGVSPPYSQNVRTIKCPLDTTEPKSGETPPLLLVQKLGFAMVIAIAIFGIKKG